MACYIVSYDLLAPGRNYEGLYGAIKSYTGWARINESVWAVVTHYTAVQVRDQLSRYIDPNDRIFVLKSGVEAAWRNTLCDGHWLKENL